MKDDYGFEYSEDFMMCYHDGKIYKFKPLKSNDPCCKCAFIDEDKFHCKNRKTYCRDEARIDSFLRPDKLTGIWEFFGYGEYQGINSPFQETIIDNRSEFDKMVCAALLS